MSAPAPMPAPRSEDRLLSFEADDVAYALPIASVLEVAEGEPLAAVPSLPRACGGVMNWHGDALPVLWPSLLFAGVPDPAGGARTPAHVLVVAERDGGGARLGLPVDCVLGLVDGPAAAARPDELVAERRSIEGRVVSVLDPRRVVARAGEMIQRSAEPIHNEGERE